MAGFATRFYVRLGLFSFVGGVSVFEVRLKKELCLVLENKKPI